MALDADEEILQDFLIEAGEILESMSEQLIALENQPDDMELLNGIFRGFHTVKGGAGFLALEPLVEICHITENIFDILRKGERQPDADLMDHILQALDLVNDMFADVRSGEYPQNAEPEFLQKLGTYAVLETAAAAPAASEAAPLTNEDANSQPDPSNSDISDDEFDALLDELNVAKATEITQNKSQSADTQLNTPQASSDGDDISDDEFEALLDELHGEGQFSSDKQKAKSAPNAKPASTKASSDEISDDEFENLLDELHGKGSPITAASTKTPPTATPLTATPPTATSGAADMIGDDEFEALLDQLHGSGTGPSQASKSTKPAVGSTSPTNKTSPEAVNQKPKATPQTLPKPAPKSAPSQAAKKAPAGKRQSTAVVAEATVRVDTKRLDEIMNMVGELVLARNRLKTLGLNSQDEQLTKAIGTLDLVTADLQGAVMKTRMQPIKKVFGRFPRVVRDLARSLEKDISLEMIGEETDLDKNLVEALADPLVHLVRNSVDHGIESPADRLAAGKSQNGKIILSAAQEGDHIKLAIEDDGKGMDADVLRQIAVDKGLMDKESADRLSENECYNLIFMAGFSSKKEISDISGRGVGMDVVKTKISQLNGSLAIDSELGKGTTILIKVPLTLAILPTLMVMVRNQTFALPLTAVNEIFNLNLEKTNIVDGQLVTVVRDKALPLFFLNEWLSREAPPAEQKRQGHVVLMQVGTQRVGFVVDSLIGQEEVVIKPLGKSLQGTPGMAGATITSDGGIALIVDIPSMLKHYLG